MAVFHTIHNLREHVFVRACTRWGRRRVTEVIISENYASEPEEQGVFYRINPVMGIAESRSKFNHSALIKATKS